MKHQSSSSRKPVQDKETGPGGAMKGLFLPTEGGAEGGAGCSGRAETSGGNEDF